MALPSGVLSAETISEARAGSRSALEAIFRVYQPALIRYLGTRPPDLADDVASQTWVSVAESIAGFEGDGMALRGWILTIGYRRLVDEFRRQGRRLDDPAEIPEISDDVTPEDVVTSRVGWAQRLLSELPAQQADVVMLRVIGGLSVEAVATATGLTRANVRVLSHRGLARLQDLVARDPEAAASENMRSDVTEPGPRAMY